MKRQQFLIKNHYKIDGKFQVVSGSGSGSGLESGFGSGSAWEVGSGSFLSREVGSGSGQYQNGSETLLIKMQNIPMIF